MIQRFAWLRRRKWLLLRAVITALASLVIGFAISVIRSDAFFPTLDKDSLLLLAPSGLPFALASFLLLTLLEIWVGRMLCSPHLATRLILWELMAAVLLLAAMAGYVAITLSHGNFIEDRIWFFQQFFPVLAACLLVFLVLFWITRRLLAPLDIIRGGLEEFYTCGGGNTMPLSDIPHTELYEVGRVFNQLSLQTQTQRNDVQAINAAYQRLIPVCFLQLLQKTEVSALTPGDMVTQPIPLLILAFWESDNLEQAVPVLHRAVDSIGAFGGMVTNYDVELKVLITLFPTSKQALACARAALVHNLPVTAVLLQEQVTLEIFGGEHLLFPLTLSPHMARRLDLIALLRQFGARVIRCGGTPTHLRLLGWDDGLPFYEEIRWRGSAWLSLWQEAQPLWDQALELYRQSKFAPAMRKLARVLSILPNDQAARWYLFRCETLRDADGKTPDLDLLSHWESRP